MHDDLIRRAEAALDRAPAVLHGTAYKQLVLDLLTALKAQQAEKDCRTCENRYACARPENREQIGCVNGDKHTGYEPVQLWRRT